MKCLDRFGSSDSILFRNFEVSKLSLEQIDRLEKDDQFVWSFVSESNSKSICSLVSECLKGDRNIEKLVHENQRLRNEVVELGQQFVSELARIETQLSSALVSFNTKFEE
jgi:cell division protein FtsB